MTFLLLSLASLALAPLLYGWLHRWRRLHDLFDTVLIAFVVLFVSLEVVTESYERIGLVGPLLGLAGMALPSAIEQGFSRLALSTHRLTGVLGGVALAVHSLMDGATLASSSAGFTAIAVVLHQMPLGIAVWWLVCHALNRGAAIVVLAGMCAATVLGFLLTQTLLPLMEAQVLAGLQALLAGALLHVLIHRHKPRHNHP